MNGKLTIVKNIAWAIAIGLSLLALLVGLMITAFARYGGEKERAPMVLGLPNEPSAGVITVGKHEDNESPALVPQSDDAGQAYIDSLTFLLDSSTVGLRDYGLLSGGTGTQQVWGSSAGNLPASELGSLSIRYPADGSTVSVSDAVMITKPSRLVISVGADSLGNVTQEQFVEGYRTLLQSIRESSPDTVILCCSLLPVGDGYAGSDGLNNAMIQEANGWLLALCEEMGCYYLDTNTFMQDGREFLIAEYASANNKTLNSAGLNAFLTYLRTHAV